MVLREMPIQAISFDFWNTLFTEPPGGFRYYQDSRRLLLRAALRDCGDFADERLTEAFLAESRAHNRIWREEHRTLSAIERVGVILNHLQVCLPNNSIADLAQAYETGILQRPPVVIEGVNEALKELAGHYRLGIISDVGFSPGRVLRRVMEETGLIGFFDSLVFSDEAGRSKPHRDVFERTAQSLRAAPKEIVHVGDLEHTDIEGARMAGFRAIRFVGVTPMNEDETTRADFVTADFSEVPQLVRVLGRQE